MAAARAGNPRFTLSLRHAQYQMHGQYFDWDSFQLIGSVIGCSRGVGARTIPSFSLRRPNPGLILDLPCPSPQGSLHGTVGACPRAEVRGKVVLAGWRDGEDMPPMRGCRPGFDPTRLRSAAEPGRGGAWIIRERGWWCVGTAWTDMANRGSRPRPVAAPPNPRPVEMCNDIAFALPPIGILIALHQPQPGTHAQSLAQSNL